MNELIDIAKTTMEDHGKYSYWRNNCRHFCEKYLENVKTACTAISISVEASVVNEYIRRFVQDAPDDMNKDDFVPDNELDTKDDDAADREPYMKKREPTEWELQHILERAKAMDKHKKMCSLVDLEKSNTSIVHIKSCVVDIDMNETKYAKALPFLVLMKKYPLNKTGQKRIV